mgnify:CR=1 FL=1
MNAEEVAKVLAKIALGDNRRTDARETLLEWMDNIGDLDYADAIEAVRMHRKESTAYLMPAHIRDNVKAIKALRNPSNDTTPGGYRQVEVLKAAAGFPPKPLNWDAMSDAWDDPVRFAAETAKYDEQLIAAGFQPVRRGRWVA